MLLSVIVMAIVNYCCSSTSCSTTCSATWNTTTTTTTTTATNTTATTTTTVATATAATAVTTTTTIYYDWSYSQARALLESLITMIASRKWAREPRSFGREWLRPGGLLTVYDFRV